MTTPEQETERLTATYWALFAVSAGLKPPIDQAQARRLLHHWPTTQKIEQLWPAACLMKLPGPPLTRRQAELLAFLWSYRDEHGYAPTHREICEEFGYSSYGTVNAHLRHLEAKGYISRQRNAKRGLILVRRPVGKPR